MKERGPGRNFTDRQRIKRKAARWAAKFADLPSYERDAVMSAIVAAEEDARDLGMGVERCTCGHSEWAHAELKPRSCERNGCNCLHFVSDDSQTQRGLAFDNPHISRPAADAFVAEIQKSARIEHRRTERSQSEVSMVECPRCSARSKGLVIFDGREMCRLCRKDMRGFSPMPDSGVTKLSPRESAERGAHIAR